MTKTLHATYKNRKIELENHWTNGFKIIVDDKLIHHDQRMIHADRDKPFFTFKLKTEDGLEPAAVFVKTGLIDIEILLQVGGETVARTDVPPEDIIA